MGKALPACKEGGGRGPVRRSRYPAIDVRQLSVACFRSAAVIVTCVSFSASAKVAAVMSGPAAGSVPNADGAPGVALLPGVALPDAGEP
jgi:hypothetical protein